VANGRRPSSKRRPSWTDQFEPYLNRDAFPITKMAAPNSYRGTGLDASELERLILAAVDEGILSLRLPYSRLY
jgi:hypothetical protein